MPRDCRRAGVSILGRETVNLVLKVFATGGVYIAGGVALHWIDILREHRFMQAFSNQGRFKDLTGRIPVHAITARAALVGAAAYGLETLGRRQGRA